MAKIFECGYMRSSIILNFEKHHHSKKHDRYLDFMTQFNFISLNEKHFHRKSADLDTFLRKKHCSGEKKRKFQESYSLEKWENLSQMEREKHTLFNCKQCETKQISTSTPIRDLCSTNIPVVENHQVKTPYIISAATSFLNHVNTSWETLYSTPFTVIIRKIPDVNLTPRKTKIEKQKRLRQIHRNVKKSIENSWAEDGRDVETLFGTRQSGSRHDKQRKTLFLEGKKQAVQRTIKGK